MVERVPHKKLILTVEQVEKLIRSAYFLGAAFTAFHGLGFSGNKLAWRTYQGSGFTILFKIKVLKFIFLFLDFD
jgi:hypothetical protein